MTADTLVPLIVIGAGIVVLLMYFFLVQWRRQRYRQLAAAIGAEYMSQGVFKTGKIAGTSNGRTYEVEIKPGSGSQRSHSSLCTAIEMQCANKGICLHIHGRFFKDFPNWPGGEKERFFGANVILQDMGTPLDEKHGIEVQSLFQEFAIADGTLLTRGEIIIEKDNVSIKLPGIVKKQEEVQNALSVLARLAERIESAPIA
jgi:hypothetical protein